MNKYEIQLTSLDRLGVGFVEDVIKLTKQGAEVKDGTTIVASFPHKAWFTLETEELLETKPGMRVFPISVIYTRPQLDDMDWDTFRSVVNKVGVRGRHRDTMTVQYLRDTGQDWKTIPGSDKSVAQSTEEPEQSVLKVESSEVSEEASENKEE